MTNSTEKTAALIQVSELHLDKRRSIQDADPLVCRANGLLAISLLYVADPGLFVAVLPKENGSKRRVVTDIYIASNPQDAIKPIITMINDWFADYGGEYIFMPLAALNQINEGDFESGFIMLPEEENDESRKMLLQRAQEHGGYIKSHQVAEYVQDYAIMSQFTK